MRLTIAALWLFMLLAINTFATGDSLNYLTTQDTIFLKLGPDKEKIFYHDIEPKQTLFSLAKFYGLTIESLYFYNPDIRDNVVSIGHSIKIPIPNRAIKRYKNGQFDDSKHVPICYVVQKGDNLFGIAKRVFKMPIDTVMQRNGLLTFDLKIGQILKVGWMSIDGITTSQRAKAIPPEWRKSYAYQKRFINQKKYKRLFREQGVASWNKKSKTNSDLYALHRRAAVNSIIGVTNPMNKRTVYVRVIGRIPKDVYQDNVRVVLSNRAVNLLGARDAKFFVRVQYLR